MRRTAVLIVVVLVMALLAIMSADAAVRNISLSSTGTQGVSGTATAITSTVGGSMPFTNVELNAKMNSAPSANMIYEAWLFNTTTSSANSLGVFNGTMFNMKTRMSSFGTGPYDSIAISMEPVNDTDAAPSTIVARGSLPGTMVSATDFPTMAVLPPDEMFQRQVIMQRFNLTSSQVMDLRMRGWDYSDISVAANAASRCNKSINDVVAMIESGQSWDMIASSCNITVAQLLDPVPVTAVAGSIETLTPGTGTIMVPTVYLRYPNGRPIVTRDTWVEYSRRGFSWRDVAVAANISARTGDNIDDLLRMTRIQGMTWREVAIERGLDIDEVMDVSMWPFEQGPAQRDWQYGMPGTTGTGTMTMPMPPATSTPGGTGTGTPPMDHGTNGGTNY